MSSLINKINLELNLNIDVIDLKESLLDVEKNLTISTVKSLNNDYFTQITRAYNENNQENKIPKELYNFFIKCNQLYNDWIYATTSFENKTLKMIEEKQSSGIDLMSEDELEQIKEAFFDDNQNIYESIEFLSSNLIINNLFRKYNKTLLKENIGILFQ